MWSTSSLLAAIAALLAFLSQSYPIPRSRLARPALHGDAVVPLHMVSGNGPPRAGKGEGRVSVSAVGTFVAGGLFATLLGLLGSSNPTYNTAADIKPSVFAKQQTLGAVVVKVIDGDTYRVRHVPWAFSSAKVAGPLKDNTIVVRAYAIDSPETSKFGKPAQQFAEVSKEFAKKRLLDKPVKVQCLSRDQYGRVVGKVTYDGRDISEDLLSEGLAVVYRQGGAQYGAGEGVDKWDRLEERARRARKNLWKNGPAVELPADYKRAQKQAAAGSGLSPRNKFTRTGKNAEAYIK